MRSLQVIGIVVSVCAMTVGVARVPAEATIPPVNDDFGSATTLSGSSGSITGTNAGATVQSGETGHPSGPNHSVWYSWTAPFSGVADFSLCGSDFDTIMGVYTGSAVNALTEVTSGDDSGCGLASDVSFHATSSTVYYIAVDGFTSGDVGNISLAWAKIPTPANDDFANAITLPGGTGSIAGKNTNATTEDGEPGHPYGPYESVWYEWVAPSSRLVEFDTCNSDFNQTMIAAYTGSAVNALTEVASDAGSKAKGCGSGMIAFQAVSGTHYFIAVDTEYYGWTFTLNWTDQYRPDLLVKKSSASAFTGDDVYSPDDQRASAQVLPGKRATFTIEFQNDGTLTDTFSVSGCDLNGAYKTTYLDGSTDVTADVTSGAYSVSGLAPGATKDLLLEVQLSKKAKGSRDCLVRATSTNYPSLSDTVVAHVRAKGTPGSPPPFPSP